MEELRTQQIEALQDALEYCAKLKNGIKNVTGELKGDRLIDTDEYLKEVLDGLNWLIQVVNATLDLINKDDIQIEKEVVNETVNSLSIALKEKDDAAVADLLEGGIMTFIDKFIVAGEAIVGAN